MRTYQDASSRLLLPNVEPISQPADARKDAMDASDAPLVLAQTRWEHDVRPVTASGQGRVADEQREARRALVLDAQALLSRRRARRRGLRTVAR